MEGNGPGVHLDPAPGSHLTKSGAKYLEIREGMNESRGVGNVPAIVGYEKMRSSLAKRAALNTSVAGLLVDVLQRNGGSCRGKLNEDPKGT